MSFRKACGADEVPADDMASFYVDGVEVLLVPRGGALRAFDGICPHEDFALVDGFFDGDTITCIGHGWTFDASSGRGITTPCRLRQFPVRVEGDTILVDLDDEILPPAMP